MSTVLSDHEVRENLAANVQRLLVDRRMSQAELSRRSGESEMNISRVVRGTAIVGTGIVARIAEAFDVSIDRLVSPPPQKTFAKIANSA